MIKPILNITVDNKLFVRKDTFYCNNNTEFTINITNTYNYIIMCSIISDDNLEPFITAPLKPMQDYSITSVFKSDEYNSIDYKVSVLLSLSNEKPIFYKDFFFFNKHMKKYINLINKTSICTSCNSQLEFGWDYCPTCGLKK